MADEQEKVVVEKHIYHKGDSPITTILKGIGWLLALPFRIFGSFFKWIMIIIVLVIVGYFAFSIYGAHVALKDSGYTETVRLLNNIDFYIVFFLSLFTKLGRAVA